MSLLRASVWHHADGSQQMKLLDLDIVVEGRDEQELLAEVSHALTTHYRLARAYERTPFVGLLCEDRDVAALVRAWEQDQKSLRKLDLAPEVREALSIALRTPKNIEECGFSQGSAA